MMTTDSRVSGSGDLSRKKSQGRKTGDPPKLRRMSKEELRSMLAGMRPEDKDQFLGDIVEQLKAARTNKDLPPERVQQIDVAIDEILLRLKMNYMEGKMANWECEGGCGEILNSYSAREHQCSFPCRQCKQKHEDGLPHKGMRCPACRAGCVPLKKRSIVKPKGSLTKSLQDDAHSPFSEGPAGGS